jgi:hypothetical protein
MPCRAGGLSDSWAIGSSLLLVSPRRFFVSDIRETFYTKMGGMVDSE